MGLAATEGGDMKKCRTPLLQPNLFGEVSLNFMLVVTRPREKLKSDPRRQAIASSSDASPHI
jgi:hypothetical protein